MKWYRVVLDEAQFIRNRYVMQRLRLAPVMEVPSCIRATRASIVVAQLRTKFRWMLTGTPVTNALYEISLPPVRKDDQLGDRSDLYGLIRFGHFRPWNDWQSFNDHIVRRFLAYDLR